ncbi:MAG: hypothetical protein CMJ81_03825 [Planctomycetaceae bacterium]|nr:hypothetical protein [Planctomycetaceae bacterium]
MTGQTATTITRWMPTCVVGLFLVATTVASPAQQHDAAGFWSLQPVTAPAVPTTAVRSWPKSPIDQFVLSRLEHQALTPVASADRRTWLRRVTMDLTGLPPSPGAVREFERDDSGIAYEKVVDRLLASPYYGERWARYWLDVARYAEEQHHGAANSYETLPHAYKYRDWVVSAFNHDLPYDQFIVQQIAGDLVDGLGSPGWEAVGFLALGPIYTTDGGEEDDQLRVRYDTIDDKIDTISSGFLGLTTACARCHDHKFDPISIEDYYGLAGVFYNSRYVTHRWLVPPDVVEPYQQARERIDRQETLLAQAEQDKTAKEPGMPGRIEKLSAELERLKQAAPAMPPSYQVHTLVDVGSEDVPVARRGNPMLRGAVVPRRFLQVLTRATPVGDHPPPFTRGSGRLELARAIADRRNPLTARVMANRIWQHHFGQGLVRTPNNFGALGESPTHPGLLDWLATRFVQNGWSVKRLHRDMVLSQTYRLGGRFRADNFAKDGDNQFLWRFQPRRLDIEAWRDALLMVTGELDFRIGGPPVEDILASSRRTLYAPIRRDSRFPSDRFLRLFDFPSPWHSRGQRTATTVPLQQLFILNGDFMIERARALVRRLAHLESDEDRIEQAFSRLFLRRPSREEFALALEFLQSPTAEENPVELTRWQQYAQVLLSSNEFLYLR